MIREALVDFANKHGQFPDILALGDKDLAEEVKPYFENSMLVMYEQKIEKDKIRFYLKDPSGRQYHA